MKKLGFLLIALVPFNLLSQNYVDILKVGYSENFNSELVNTGQSTNVKSIDVDFTYPIELNEKNAIITGVLYSRNKLEIFPEPDFNLIDIDTETFPQYYKSLSLHTTILKLGLARTFNEKWSGTFVFLPKLASDYKEISGDDFYLGGVALLKYQKTKHLKYKMGFFALDQEYGWFTTPILGCYYLSPNAKFEMDISAPISADINYAISPSITLGFNYVGISRSFNVHQENVAAYYVDYGTLEFTGYAQYGFLDNTVLLRAKVGYADFDAEAYAEGDKVNFRLSAFNIGGDDRQRLNPNLSSGIFGKIEAVYRFDISDKK